MGGGSRAPGIGGRRMLNVDPVKLSESYPKSTLMAQRVRSALGGKNYYFNGQKSRARVFNTLVGQVPFQNFVETGTFLGMTTDFLARTARGCRAQVYSCEIDQRHYAIASSAVGYRRNVHLHHGNSVDYLRSLASGLSRAVNFVYLDAHWNDYLPLRDELTIVREWNNTIVMIDDFKVPSDGRFGWDKYDDEREICLEHIDGAKGDNDVYFPAYPATDEGAVEARGYCMIAMSAPLRQTLDHIDLLERHGRPGGTVRQQ
jgi:predicted O-methyltransferase YrrM